MAENNPANIKNKRSVGVTVLAILFIVCGLFSELSLVSLFTPKSSYINTIEFYGQIIQKALPPTSAEEIEMVGFVQKLIEAQKEFMNSRRFAFLSLFNIIIGIVFFVLGIGFLRRGEWSRIAAIIFHILLIPLFAVITHFLLQPFVKAVSILPGFENIKSAYPVMLAIQVFFSAVLILPVVYYLTRPKIKEQFIQK